MLTPTKRATGCVCLALAIAGCKVGPKYDRPNMPTTLPTGYKENQPGADEARANGWRPANPNDAMLRGKWWEVFNDADLNALQESLVINNQNIRQSFSNYMAALAVVRSAKASLYPTVSIAPRFSVTGTERGSSVTAVTPVGDGTTVGTGGSGSSSHVTRSYSLPVSASWEPDLFGRLGNTLLENANAAQVSAATLENEILSEQSSLAQAYFELRGQDALQELFDQTVASYRDSLKVTQARFRNGVDTDQDVAQAELNLRSAEANASGVANTRAQYEHAIALLTGHFSSDFSVPKRKSDAIPPYVPTGVPSQLLERRPDIAAAERSMAEANALIGVGQAAYYPDLSLTASVGTQSSKLSNLVDASSGIWSFGGTLAESLLTFGARRALVDQYRAQYDAAVAGYRETVLTAFKEVEDYLVASRQLAEQARRQQAAVDAAARYLKIANVRYQTGVDTYLNVITAQNSLLNTRQTLVTLQTNRMTSAVQLIAALGGGWDAAELPTEKQVTDHDSNKVGLANPF